MLSFLIFGPHNNHFTDEEMERSGSMVLLQMLMPTCPADRRESLPGSSRTSGGPDQAGWPALGCRPLQSWDRPLLLPGWPLERKCLFPYPKSPPSVILITALAEVRLTIPMAEMRKLRLREGSGLARPTRYSSANGGRVWLLQRGVGGVTPAPQRLTPRPSSFSSSSLPRHANKRRSMSHPCIPASSEGPGSRVAKPTRTAFPGLRFPVCCCLRPVSQETLGSALRPPPSSLAGYLLWSLGQRRLRRDHVWAWRLI